MLSYTQVVAGIALGTMMAAVVGTAAAKDVQKACVVEKTITKKVECNYLLYLPENYDKYEGKKWPLVIYLQGAGGRGSDIKLVKYLGLPRMVAEGQQYPFIMVSPQCPEDSMWANELDGVMAMIEQVEAKYRVDITRRYITGPSLGGFGTWALAMAHPNMFAAIAPICGGGDTKRAGLIKDIPTWAFHRDADSVVPLARTQEMVDAVRAAGGNPKFTVFHGPVPYDPTGHDAWSDAYNDPEFWKWLFSQRLK